MKQTILLFITIMFFWQIKAQEVAQNILVEQYTNTRCSVCASKNPAFFSLLENYNENHIAYYPSAPYSTCVFSMHNSLEADGRTNYYGIFGGTPRVVLNGEVVNLANPMLQESRINAETGNMTPFILTANQEYINSDSVKVSVNLSTVSANSLSSLQLHVMLVENEIFYAAPNGENTHPNVFRKALYGLNGLTITPPTIGTNETFEVRYAFDPEWIKADLKVIVFVQDNSDKTVKQSAQSKRLNNEDGTTAITNLKFEQYIISPNPAQDYIILGENVSNIEIYNLIGKKMNQIEVTNNGAQVQNLASGIYFIQFKKDEKIYTSKFLKK